MIVYVDSRYYYVGVVNFRTNLYLMEHRIQETADASTRRTLQPTQWSGSKMKVDIRPGTSLQHTIVVNWAKGIIYDFID